MADSDRDKFAAELDDIGGKLEDFRKRVVTLYPYTGGILRGAEESLALAREILDDKTRAEAEL